MVVRQVLVDWTTVTGKGGLSVLNFGTEGSVALLSGTIMNALNGLAPALHGSTTARPRSEIRLIDEASGDLIGTESFGATTTVTGSSSEPRVVPDLCQGLVTHLTGVVRAGRRVKGHTFVPGMADDRNVDEGELSAPMVNALLAFGAQLRGGTNTLRVYSRPRPGLPGASTLVNGTATSLEFSPLRRRR